MSTRNLRNVLILLAVAMVAACGTMHRVSSAPYGYGHRENLTIAELRPALEDAAIVTGWTVSNAQDGSYTAFREWGGGKHAITVDVVYTPTNYSINYKDSRNLGYDGGNNIHRSYTEFVMELEHKINDVTAKL